MAEQRGSKGLSRADVLVAAVVCLLLIVLVPVLFARPREQSMRKVCAANLAQIGKAMFVYAGDYEDELPRAGGTSTTWGITPNWMAPDRRMVFSLRADGGGGQASISSCFYLLVKYMQVSPRLFVCKGDRGTTEFKLSDRTDVPLSLQPADVWDFGPPVEAFKHCSYAYHMPFGLYALTTSSDPNMAVAADRNPWLASPAATPSPWADFRPDIISLGLSTSGNAEQARKGNSVTHRNDGQNVLFVDGRVSFERRAYCGLDKDNIYTISRDTTRGDTWGIAPPATGSTWQPMNRRDSVLVHGTGFAGVPSGPKR